MQLHRCNFEDKNVKDKKQEVKFDVLMAVATNVRILSP
jgi:hypothetical protein